MITQARGVLGVGIVMAWLARTSALAAPEVRVDLVLSLPEGDRAAEVAVEIPRLKFDKRVLMSYTMDDDVAGAYGRIFTVINNKWVDDLNYAHQGIAPSTGFLPGKTLGYTDGTGIEKRFAAGVAVWPQAGNKWMSNFMLKSDPPADWRDPYLKWYEIPLLLDFGFSVYEHNTGTDDPDSVEKIARGFERCQEITRQQLDGRGFKVLMEPDGNYRYCEAAWLYPPIKMVCNQGRGKSIPHHPLTDDPAFEKTVITRRFHSTRTVEEEFAYVKQNHDSANPLWYHFSTHAPGEFVQRLLRLINDAYGKEGCDDIWFATCDEYYEYVEMRRHSTLEVERKGRQVVIHLAIPQGEDFYYNDLSLLVKHVADPASVGVTAGTNVNALSWARQGSNLLVNVGFNPRVLERAERYTRKFEASRLPEDGDDARYFVSQLRKELRAPLQSRIDHVVVRAPLILEELKTGRAISDGQSLFIPVTFRCNRPPSQVKLLSEREHTRVPWKAYEADKPLELKIRMTTNAVQNVFLIVKDNENTSFMLGREASLADPLHRAP